MKLYYEIIKLLFNKFIKKQKNGESIRIFSENMGIVYIKLAQILATQNFGKLFNEEDRKILSSICDNCQTIPFEEIKNIIDKEYGESFYEIYKSIDPNPIGSASVSQVYKAILKDGREVVLKIKRIDIANNIEDEIKMIKKIIHKYGRFINFSNFLGGDKALNLYLEWIIQETDFIREKNNMKAYQVFVNSINSKLEETKKIKMPKLYDEYCTENIIVMEYIKNETINKMVLNDENKETIAIAINSYIKLIFSALFNEEYLILHGDPHNGNIYIDDDGNIGFLDMGLMFKIDKKEIEEAKAFFLAAYSGNYEKLYDLLIPYGDMNDKEKWKFKQNIKIFCQTAKDKTVTEYFIDMINVILDCNFAPPNYLFCMAKSFICLNGINGFSNNIITSNDLLKEQIIEFQIERLLKDCENTLINGVANFSKVINNYRENGLVKSLSKGIVENEKIYNEARKTIDNFNELLNIVFYNSQENKTTTNKNDFSRKR